MSFSFVHHFFVLLVGCLFACHDRATVSASALHTTNKCVPILIFFRVYRPPRLYGVHQGACRGMRHAFTPIWLFSRQFQWRLRVLRRRVLGYNMQVSSVWIGTKPLPLLLKTRHTGKMPFLYLRENATHLRSALPSPSKSPAHARTLHANGQVRRADESGTVSP